MRHIHLDPLGGVAGDMFVAALAHACPEHEAEAVRTAERIAGVPCRIVPYHDRTLTGLRFDVLAEPHHHDHDHHRHTSWRDIRDRLQTADLSVDARAHAIGIFAVLADAEARVHGVEPEAVTFHEVGAADSVADIVAAAVLIASLGPASWSTAPLPLGGGRIRTAHGIMPVPAPATALLLEGFITIDDGIAGERVTPTGAAVLRHLQAHSSVPPTSRRLAGTGFGFGTKTFPGISNCLRVLIFDEASEIRETPASHTTPAHRELAVISFEVDDQSPEDLATGLDAVRALPFIHDVVQIAAFGKKNRMCAHVQILVRPDALDAAIEACFRETTTIGLRLHTVRGMALPRQARTVQIDDHPMRVKLVERPGGVTGKAESDDVRQISGHAARIRMRREAERRAEQTADD